MHAPTPIEASLDPTDWATFRAQAHQVLDDTLTYLETIGQRPVWQPPTPEALASYQAPLPETPGGFEAAYAEFLKHIVPHTIGNPHPRFWGWVQGGGTPQLVLAELLATALNTNSAIGNHVGLYLELQVLGWLKALLGWPATASGLLTSGASMANVVALTVARNSLTGTDVRAEGLAPLGGKLRVYSSAETHNCVHKALDLIGLGRIALRSVPVDADYRINLAALEGAIAEDRAAGLLPFALVGNAGTVNTGATDPLDALADIATREQLWYHIDGAFGALAWLVPEQRAALRGLQRADSLSFDLHKWPAIPYEAGCVLVKDAEKHRAAFASPTSYLAHHPRGLSAGPDPLANYGPELSRGFRALKVWFGLKVHGPAEYRRIIAQNIAQAQYLAAQVAATPELELLAPAPLNIVCYRYRSEGLGEAALNALNKDLLMALHEQGLAAPTYTLLGGRYAIRVAHTNHRSTHADFDALVADTLRLGRALRVAYA